MTEPLQPAAAPDHDRHDPELIAGLAARTADTSDPDIAAARELVRRCAGCRDLLSDLIALQVALPTTATPSRPRDFSLTVADAHRLRAGGWRRVLSFVGSARDSVSRPLAIAFTTIGVVALVITAAPPFSFGMATSGAAPRAAAPIEAAPMASAAPAAAPSIAAPAPSAAPSAAAAALSPAATSAEAAAPAASAQLDRERLSALPYATTGDQGGVFTGSGDDGSSGDIQGEPDDSSVDQSLLSLRTDGDGPSLGVVIAGICLIIGLGLFALRWTSRRLEGS